MFIFNKKIFIERSFVFENSYLIHSTIGYKFLVSLNWIDFIALERMFRTREVCPNLLIASIRCEEIRKHNALDFRKRFEMFENFISYLSSIHRGFYSFISFHEPYRKWNNFFEFVVCVLKNKDVKIFFCIVLTWGRCVILNFLVNYKQHKCYSPWYSMCVYEYEWTFLCPGKLAVLM